MRNCITYFIGYVMNRKQVSGIVLLFLGIIMTIFAVQSMNRISPNMADARNRSCWSSCEDRMMQRSRKHPRVMWSLMGGIALGVVGVSMAAFGGKKKK